MTTFDRLLTDPSADDLAGTLAEAAPPANAGNPRAPRRRPGGGAAGAGGCGRGPAPAAVFARPGGISVWVSAAGGGPRSHVGAAWWVAPLGRRHVRVVGRRAFRRTPIPIVTRHTSRPPPML